MFVYPSGGNVSSSALRFLADRLRKHRRTIGTRWRRLNAGRQALLALAHLRDGQPYAQLAAGFGIGTTTAYRYIAEAVELLAARRDASAHRPHRCRPAFLLGQTQEARRERAGHSRPQRTPALVFTGPGRRCP